MPVNALFKPFHLGHLQLPSRVVMAPMTRSFSPGGVPNSKVIEYYRRRAAAGVGLIITEGATVNHKEIGRASWCRSRWSPYH